MLLYLLSTFYIKFAIKNIITIFVLNLQFLFFIFLFRIIINNIYYLYNRK